MSDLISRSELIAKIKPPTDGDYTHTIPLGNVRKMLLNFANSVPSVDAVEVVRCKDCKYFEFAHDCNFHAADENGTPIFVRKDDFCSYGERREDD